MENGGDTLVPKLVGLNLNDSNNVPKNNDGLFQVLKAVEAAEATIKQQVCYSFPHLNVGFNYSDDESVWNVLILVFDFQIV